MRKWSKIAAPIGIAVLLVSVLAVGFSVPDVDAAKGGKGKGGGDNGGEITVPDGVFGGTTVATVNPGGDNVWVHAECFQDGALVYEQYVGADSNMQAILHLGPTPSWTGGEADCTAEELTWVRHRFRVVAATTFHVEG